MVRRLRACASRSRTSARPMHSSSARSSATVNFERRDSRMPFADLAGARIHYQIDGSADAPLVMFSNSLGTNLTMWDSQVASLKTRYRLLRYDTRGHGESAVTAGPYTMEQLARDALVLLDALAI